MRKALAAIVVAAAISGCATGDKMGHIEPGMNRTQVNEIMGAPDGYQQQSGYEILKYANRLMSGWGWDRSDYYVLLKDGKVAEYGNGVVREKSPNSGILVVAPIR